MTISISLGGDADEIMPLLEKLLPGCDVVSASVEICTRTGWDPWFSLSTVDEDGADRAREEVTLFENKVNSRDLGKLENILDRLEQLTSKPK